MSELIGCEWSDDEENTISFAALERRGLLCLMNNETQAIRLVWHKPQQPRKTHPTVFRVVPDADLPVADIRFGKNWMQGAPMEVETSLVGGKRKWNPGRH